MGGWHCKTVGSLIIYPEDKALCFYNKAGYHTWTKVNSLGELMIGNE